MMEDYSSTQLRGFIRYDRSLVTLDLSRKGLSQVPDAVTELSELEFLWLDGNNLTELPTSINKLKNLKWLVLDNNQLSKLPDAVTELSELEELWLEGNNLTELPTSINKLKNLKVLHLNNNKLSKVPDAVTELSELEFLWLDGNNLTELPTSMGEMKELRLLRVFHNPFTIDAMRSLLKLKDKKKGKIDIHITERDIVVPAEIEARGQRAQLAYQKALSDGAVNVYRGRLFLIGQDRAGKTSLKKSLIGLPFDPKEQSTEGIEVDPSTFQVDVDQVKNWKSSDKHKQELLGCSKAIARVVVQNLQNDSDDYSNDNSDDNRKKQKTKTINIDRDDSDASGDLDDETGQEEDDDSYIEQVAEQNIDEVSEHKSTQPELMVNATLPPDELTNDLTKYMRELIIKGEIKQEETIYTLDLWDFAGQHLYYASHPIFFSLRGIYLLVYNLSKSINATAEPCVRQEMNKVSKLKNPNGETNVENLLSWLVTLDSITQMRGELVDSVQGSSLYLRPPVIIVGTHADKPCEDITSMKSQIQERILKMECGGHLVSPIFSIDNTAAGKMHTPLHEHQLQKVDPLTLDGYGGGHWVCDKCDTVSNATSHPFHCSRQCQYDLCHFCAHTNMIKGEQNSRFEIKALQDKISEVLRQEPYMREKLPVRWVHFEKIVDTLVEQNAYYIDIEELQTYAKDGCLITDKEEFITMMNFYHDLGIIIKHRSTVILKAQWLIDLFRQLITIPHFDDAVRNTK